MGRPADRQIGKLADGQVERRVRLDTLTAIKLGVAAQIRGMTESELVAWALLPHLSFELPELPDVAMSPLPTAGQGGHRPRLAQPDDESDAA